jgi:ribosomal protein S18 acetylase RimI-like enzyme/predicted nucleotidyltransferase
MIQQIQQRPSPYEIAKELLETRFKGAEVVFAAGSIRRNEATASSDIDLVVVYPKLEQAYRESFTFKGWPVEAFVHDPETLNYFFWEVDAKDGTPSLPFMVVEGQAIPESHPLVNRLKSLADRVLDAGPAKYSDEQLKNLRYGISDLLDDLRSPRNDFELKTIVGKLHEQLGDFWFRAQDRWSASGKHIPRRMQKLDPSFAESWVKAFNAALSGKTIEIIALAENVLSKYGGYIFDGYRRDAPKEWRKALPPPKYLTNGISLPKIHSGLQTEEAALNHNKLGKIDIRLVTVEDIQNLRLLLNSAYKQLADLGLNFNATFLDDESTADGLVDGRTFVLYRKDQLIGTIKIRKHNYVDDRPCLYVSRLAVRPDLQKNGLGLFLMNLAERIAKREEFKCMQLDTAQPAEHLLKIYQDYGFKIIRPIYYEGNTYCSWILEKSI